MEAKKKPNRYFDRATVIKHIVKNATIKKAIIFVPMSAIYIEGVRNLMHLN